MGTADPRAQKSRYPSGTCRNHGSTKRMDAQSTGLDRYSERKERGELEWDCAGMHAGGRYTRSNALLIAYGAPVPCGHVSSNLPSAPPAKLDLVIVDGSVNSQI